MTTTTLTKQFLALLILALTCLTATAPAEAQEVRWQYNYKCTFSVTNCEIVTSIPSGQRLTVEYVSTFCGAPTGAVDSVQIGVTFNGTAGQWQGVALNTANAGVTSNATMVNLYADQNTYLYLNIERLTGAWSGYGCNVLITGHTDTNVTQ